MARVALSLLVAAALALPSGAAGAVVGWGSNTTGQLGAGFKSGSQGATTAKVPGSCAPKELGSGVAWTLVLCQDGRVFGWGSNQLGQLAQGRASNPLVVPTLLPLAGVKQIAAGGSHSIALLADGTVRVWGSNLFGEAGDGTSTHGSEAKGGSVLTPRPVPGLSGVCGVAAGGPDDLAVMCDGSVRGWGENKAGQLGPPVSFEVPRPRVIPGLSNVVRAAVGAFPASGGHVLALLGNGTVLGLGGNGQGQLGDGTTASRTAPVAVKGLSGVTAIAASVDHSVFLRGDGTVFTSGSNTMGELGVGVGPEGCAIGRPVKTVPCSRTPVALPLHNAISVSAGFRFTVVVAGGGLPFAAGWNLRETLGDGTSVQRNSPVAVLEVGEALSVSAGSYHTEALTTGSGPPPALEVSAGVGSLTVRWRQVSVETKQWTIAWRAVAKPQNPWGPLSHAPPAARSFTIEHLTAGQPYQVRVQDVNYPSRIVTGVPLGAGRRGKVRGHA